MDNVVLCTSLNHLPALPISLHSSPWDLLAVSLIWPPNISNSFLPEDLCSLLPKAGIPFPRSSYEWCPHYTQESAKCHIQLSLLPTNIAYPPLQDLFPLPELFLFPAAVISQNIYYSLTLMFRPSSPPQEHKLHEVRTLSIMLIHISLTPGTVTGAQR